MFPIPNKNKNHKQEVTIDLFYLKNIETNKLKEISKKKTVLLSYSKL